MKNTLETYEASGQTISLSKFEIFYSKNIPRAISNVITSKYFGLYLQRLEEARKPHSNSLKIEFCVKSILAVVCIFPKQVEKCY
jgi:hypothetical protein